MTATKPRGPYAKSAEIRQRVLEACVDAFGETGFYGATMKDIAVRAGISYNGLLHHFARKEDLLIALLDLRAERSTQFLGATNARDPHANPTEALRGMIRVILENELHPGLMELHAVLSGEATSPEHPAHEHYVNRTRQLRLFYTQVYAELAKRGELESTIEPATLAAMTIALVNGLQTQWLFERDSVDIEGAIRQFLVLIIPTIERERA